MSALSRSPNHLLASLSPQDSELIRPHLAPMRLAEGAVFYGVLDTIAGVYFPFTGAVSLAVGLTSGQFVEAGMLGCNSAVGSGAAQDGLISLNQAVGQVAGAGVYVESAILKQLVAKRETLRMAFVRHEQIASAQAQQIAACNAVHNLEMRLSRWLLQTRDLLQSDVLPLTQRSLSRMLGVQRISVMVVAQQLQDAGVISYRPGNIRVRNLEALRDRSCECYEAINSHFRRLAGWSPNIKSDCYPQHQLK